MVRYGAVYGLIVCMVCMAPYYGTYIGVLFKRSTRYAIPHPCVDALGLGMLLKCVADDGWGGGRRSRGHGIIMWRKRSGEKVYWIFASTTTFLETHRKMNAILRILPPAQSAKGFSNKFNLSWCQNHFKKWHSSSGVLMNSNKFFSTKSSKHRNIGISAHIDR